MSGAEKKCLSTFSVSGGHCTWDPCEEVPKNQCASNIFSVRIISMHYSTFDALLTESLKSLAAVIISNVLKFVSFRVFWHIRDFAQPKWVHNLSGPLLY